MELKKLRPNPFEEDDPFVGGGRGEGLEPGKPLEGADLASESPMLESSIPSL